MPISLAIELVKKKHGMPRMREFVRLCICNHTQNEKTLLKGSQMKILQCKNHISKRKYNWGPGVLILIEYLGLTYLNFFFNLPY